MTKKVFKKEEWEEKLGHKVEEVVDEDTEETSFVYKDHKSKLGDALVQLQAATTMEDKVTALTNLILLEHRAEPIIIPEGKGEGEE